MGGWSYKGGENKALFYQMNVKSGVHKKEGSRKQVKAAWIHTGMEVGTWKSEEEEEEQGTKHKVERQGGRRSEGKRAKNKRKCSGQKSMGEEGPIMQHRLCFA